MQLVDLKVRNLRVLADVALELDADLVVLSGANGSGKTSLLEAIHLLGTGRSFRSRQAHDLVRRGEESLIVSGRFQDDERGTVTLGVEKTRSGSSRYRVSGEDVRVASGLARRLPLVVVTPESQRLLTDGADGRRRLLDWLMFHLEPGYQEVHGRYRRALRQRNAMLREVSGPVPRGEREAWCKEVADAGAGLAAMRAHRLALAQPVLEDVLSDLSALQVSLDYHAGWASGEELHELLLRSWDVDVARGYTASGPHRADLVIRVQGRPAQHVVSRGEGKVLVFAVMAGFARTLVTELKRRPMVLVDELASELDRENRSRFSGMLRDLGLQTLVTTVSDELVSTAGWERVSQVRLEQGKPMKVLQ